MHARGPELAEVVRYIREFIVYAGGETIGQVHCYKKSMHILNQLNPVFACLSLGKDRFGLQKLLYIHLLVSSLKKWRLQHLYRRTVRQLLEMMHIKHLAYYLGT